MARVSDEKEEEKKRGGLIPPWGGTPASGTLLRAGQSARGAGQGSWISRLLGGRGLGQLPLFPRIIPGQGFFGLTLANLLASKLGLMGVIASLLGVSAAAGTYYKNIISPRYSGSLAFRGNPFRGGSLPTDKRGYDNSMMLFNRANKGGLPEGTEDEAAASSEESSDDKNVISGPPSDTTDPNALAAKLAQSQGLPGQAQNPLDNKDKYGSAMGPFGGGGSYFQGQSGSGSGGTGALGGLAGKGLNVPKGLGGTTTAMGRKPAVSFGSRSAVGGRKGRSAFGQLGNTRNQSGRGAGMMKTSPSVGSYTSSLPFDAGGAKSASGEPMGIGGGTPIGSGITSGPDTTSGGGGPGTPNNTSSGPTDITGGNTGGYPEPTVPAVPGDKDVTPWGGLVKTATILLAIASLLLMLAYAIGKTQWGKVISQWMCYIAAALAAVVAVLGIMIITQHGQMMQGGIFTVVGGLLTILALSQAEDARSAAAQEAAKQAALEKAATEAGYVKITEGANQGLWSKGGEFFKLDGVVPATPTPAPTPNMVKVTPPPAGK